MLRYLEEEERTRCRSLWDEAFFEDSESFVEYYFEEKLKDNRILVSEEDGRIVSMIHQNPYRLWVRDEVWRVDYIVGVATAKDWRRRGCMRQLLGRMMREMGEERMPFCFLMPADEAIYRPFGFTWIFDQPQWVMREETLPVRRPLLPWQDSAGHRGYLAWIAGWMDRWLGERYQVYTVRDEAYLRRLLRELDSEAGTFDVLYDGDAMVGISSQWGIARRQQRMLLAEPQYVREQGPQKPAIMARIICLEQFVKAVRLRGAAGPEERVIRLAVEDPLVPENRGAWDWHLNRETSWLERSDGPSPALTLTIPELTRWLFGYEIPEAAREYADVVETLNGVFLDEVV